jgi:precorrin-6A/cobalt-precorrin-6A reductase
VPDVLHSRPRPLRHGKRNAIAATHRIDAVIAKNSGGSATYAKIAAARRLGIEVMMVERAHRLPSMRTVETVEAALATIRSPVSPKLNRGV